MKDFLRQEIRLSLSFFLLLFLAGRIGLLLHEFGGHALSWRLLGGTVTEYSLFLFGGGRVHYGAPASTVNGSTLSLLFVQLSGITAELAVGIPLALLARFRIADRFVKRLFLATAGILIVHSLFYLVVSSYYGSGDGRVLFALLQGGARRTFLVLTISLTVLIAFFVSYAFSPEIRSWVVARSRKQRSVLIITGVVVAGLLHGTLTVVEQIIVKDRTYAEIKTPGNVRLMEKELSVFVARFTEEHGREPRPEQIAMMRKELEEKYRQFPIEIPLAISILAAFVAGFFLSMHRDDDDECNPVVWKDVGLLCAFSVSAAVLVLFLNQL